MMTLIRLGNRIEGFQRPHESGDYIRLADNIAMRVFDAEFDYSNDELETRYINSHPITPKPISLYGFLPESIVELGEFETKILGKVISPPNPVICVSGDIGSGKTTTKKYLLSILTKTSHCNNQNCPFHRLIGEVNFSLYSNLNDLEGEKLTEELLIILCRELSGRVYQNFYLSEEMELSIFWEYEYQQKLSHCLESISFDEIFKDPRRIRIGNSSPITNEIIEIRREVLNEIRKKSELFLDYLIQIWKYIKQEKFCNKNYCVVFFIDNIDQLYPNVQQKLFELILSAARKDGPTFIVFMRPETLQGNRPSIKSFDLEDHKGPLPLIVFRERLKRFCNNPQDFYNSKDGLSLERFKLLSDYIVSIDSLLSTSGNDPLSAFLKNISGDSVRLCLLMSQNLFRVSLNDMAKEESSLNDVVRACINGGEPQFYWNSNSPIEHMFRISSGVNASFLIKPRILRYLGINTGIWKRVKDVIIDFQGFGYEEVVIREALNDLTKIKRHLVMCTGKDKFDDDSTHQKDGEYKVMLSKIGEAYSVNLLRDVNYIQEVMLDTYVEDSKFPKVINYGYLNEKFNLLRNFLKEILEVDCQETTTFLKNNHGATTAYKQKFGEHLISTDIIHGVFPSVLFILSPKSLSVPEKYKFEYLDLCLNFLSLVQEADYRNSEILGWWPKSIIEGDIKKVVDNIQTEVRNRK